MKSELDRIAIIIILMWIGLLFIGLLSHCK